MIEFSVIVLHCIAYRVINAKTVPQEKVILWFGD